MADQIQPCSCIPHQNLCCCGPQSGISVVQPACQTLPDGRVVNNPAFDPAATISYWSYKFFTDCGTNTTAITGIAVPICVTIKNDSVTVYEKIDGCGQSAAVPFILAQTDPVFGTAPAGYQWLIVSAGGRYSKGVCVELRVQLTGDFPTDIQPIKVTSNTTPLTFDCGCFQVPKCNPQGQLAVIKHCGHTIVNNQVTLNYQVNVTNTGNEPLTNVQFQDTVFVSPTLGLGAIVVTPPTLTVNTSIPGQVTISGSLGTITPGQTVVVTYTIPITSVITPRSYTINNTAIATAAGTQDISSCSTSFDAVQVSVVKCCNIGDSNRGSFKLTISSVGQSPATTVNVSDNLIIPPGLTVQFSSFGGCTAVFTSGGGPVPLNTNIAGSVDITISCSGITIPAGGSISKAVTFTIISSTAFGTATISNRVSQVSPAIPDTQVFLGAGQLPVESDIDVSLSLICKQPCS